MFIRNKFIKRRIKWLIFYLNIKRYRAFHDFAFDIACPMPTKNRTKVLKSVLSDLSKEIANFRVSDGTLLGLLRDGDIIKHDNDFDFDVEFSPKAENLVRSYAKQKKWSIGRVVYFRGKLQQLSFFDNKKFIYDFIFWYPGDRFYLNFSEPRCFRIMEKKYLSNLVQEDLGNFGIVLVPRNWESYLEYRYGESWLIPETKKGRWQETCGDMDFIPW